MNLGKTCSKLLLLLTSVIIFLTSSFCEQSASSSLDKEISYICNNILSANNSNLDKIGKKLAEHFKSNEDQISKLKSQFTAEWISHGYIKKEKELTYTEEGVKKFRQQFVESKKCLKSLELKYSKVLELFKKYPILPEIKQSWTR